MVRPGLANVLPALPLIVVHLAGLIVALVLTFRYRRTAAILALIGFAVLLLTSAASIGRGPLVNTLLLRRGRLHNADPVFAGVGCCCSAIDVAGIACLIVALWQALSAAGAKPSRPQESAPPAGEESD